MTNTDYTVFTRNNNTERVTTKSFDNELDAVKYAVLQMKRKLGNNYKEVIKPFNSMIYCGYFDKEGNFEFYIVKYNHEDKVRTIVEKFMFEV